MPVGLDTLDTLDTLEEQVLEHDTVRPVRLLDRAADVGGVEDRSGSKRCPSVEGSVVPSHPRLVNTVVDATEPRVLAEFYRELLGLRYRPGDEPGDGPDDWLVLLTESGDRLLAFQRTERLPRSTWPSQDVPAQLHLCFQVDPADDLEHHRDRAEALGATLLLHRTEEPDEPLFVMADPAGHPFCLYARPNG